MMEGVIEPVYGVLNYVVTLRYYQSSSVLPSWVSRIRIRGACLQATYVPKCHH